MLAVNLSAGVPESTSFPSPVSSPRELAGTGIENVADLVRVWRHNSTPKTFAGRTSPPVSLLGLLRPNLGFVEELRKRIEAGASEYECLFVADDPDVTDVPFRCSALVPRQSTHDNSVDHKIIFHQRNPYIVEAPSHDQKVAPLLLSLASVVFPESRPGVATLFFLQGTERIPSDTGEIRIVLPPDTTYRFVVSERTDAIDEDHVHTTTARPRQATELQPGRECPIEEYSVVEHVNRHPAELSKWWRAYTRFSYGHVATEEGSFKIAGTLTISAAADEDAYPGKRVFADALSQHSQDTTLILRLSIPNTDPGEPSLYFEFPLISKHASIVAGPGTRTVSFLIGQERRTDTPSDDGIAMELVHNDLSSLFNPENWNMAEANTTSIMASERGFLTL